MTKRDKFHPVKAGEIVSFRIPNAEYASKFNLALKASGETRAFLSMNAVDEGLAITVWKLSQGRASALAQFQKTIAIYTPHIQTPEELNESNSAQTKLPEAAQTLPSVLPLVIQKHGYPNPIQPQGKPDLKSQRDHPQKSRKGDAARNQ